MKSIDVLRLLPFFLGLQVFVLCAHGQGNVSRYSPAVKTLSPEVRSNILVKTGGLIHTPYTGKVIGVINMQNKISRSIIEGVVNDVRTFTHFPLQIVDMANGDPIKNAESFLRQSTNQFGLVVVIYDAPCSSMTQVAPESRWGLLNVASLHDPKLSPETMSMRTQKQFWRVLCCMIGIGYSQNKASVLQPISCVEQLDLISGKMITQESLQPFFTQAALFGFQRPRLTTYKKACEEGWAPMPTNQFQRSILEEVKKHK